LKKTSKNRSHKEKQERFKKTPYRTPLPLEVKDDAIQIYVTKLSGGLERKGLQTGERGEKVRKGQRRGRGNQRWGFAPSEGKHSIRKMNYLRSFSRFRHD